MLKTESGKLKSGEQKLREQKGAKETKREVPEGRNDNSPGQTRDAGAALG
jgi:hypothetical protein